MLIHIITEKGHGYEPAVSASDKMHGVAKYDILTGKQSKPKAAVSPHSQYICCGLQAVPLLLAWSVQLHGGLHAYPCAECKGAVCMNLFKELKRLSSSMMGMSVGRAPAGRQLHKLLCGRADSGG